MVITTTGDKNRFYNEVREKFLLTKRDIRERYNSIDIL